MATFANGSVVYLAHRNVWVAYMHGRIVCTKKTESDAKNWIATHATTVAPSATTKTATTKARSVVFNSNVRKTLEARTMEVVNKANVLFPTLRMDEPKVGFFQKSATAGKAHYGEWMVTYNEVIAQTNGLDVFDNTVIHEVAHLVVKKLYPFAKAHGWEFKQVMRTLGGSGERCHNYDVSAVKTTLARNYVWACGCQKHNVTGRKHTNMMKRPGAYRCKKCGVSVKFVGTV